MIKHQILLYISGVLAGIVGSVFFYYAIQLENLIGLINPKTFLNFIFFIVLTIFCADRLFLLF